MRSYFVRQSEDIYLYKWSKVVRYRPIVGTKVHRVGTSRAIVLTNAVRPLYVSKPQGFKESKLSIPAYRPCYG